MHKQIIKMHSDPIVDSGRPYLGLSSCLFDCMNQCSLEALKERFSAKRAEWIVGGESVGGGVF